MKNKEFSILILTLAVLVVLLLVVANPFKQPGTVSAKGSPLFPALLAKEPARIVVDGRNDLTLWKEGPEWLVNGDAEGEAFPADTAGVLKALRAVQAATNKEVVSANPEKQSIFQVDTTGTTVTILAADSTVLADFVIGKSGSDYATNYLRPKSDNSVYLVGERIKSQFDRPSRGLRDMFILRVPKEEITRIEITRGDTVTSVEAKADGAWEMLAPKQGVLKKDYASRLVNTISNFRGDELVAGEGEDRGFETPFLRVNVVLKNGTDRTITVGDTTKVEGRRYARLDGRKWVYEIGAYRIDTLTRPADEILEPPPAPPDSAAAMADSVPPTASPVGIPKG